MADVLTRSEMESLLAALDPSTGAGRQRDTLPSGGIPRPVRLRPEWIETLRGIHTTFARDFATSCTRLVRAPVTVQLSAVHQIPYAEFVEGLEIPTCLNLLKIEPFAGHSLLQWSPAIVYRLVDRLLGGPGTAAAAAPARPFTEIELRLLARITDLALAALRTAWADICRLEPRVKLVESHPHLLPFVAAEATIVLISFDVTFGDAQGVLNLCLPGETIESQAGKFPAAGGAPRPTSLTDRRQRGGSASVGRGVELVVHLASTRLSADEIGGLEIGDIIVTDCRPSEPLEVRIDGAPHYNASAGLVKGRKGVRITGKHPLAVGGSPASDSDPAPQVAPGAADRSRRD